MQLPDIQSLLDALTPRKRPTFLDEENLPSFGYEDMQLRPDPLHELSRPKGPKFTDRLKQALPNMIESSIAAVATPNIAFGGPVDIARSLQAGRGAIHAREALQRKKQKEDIEMATMLDLRKRQAAAADAELARAQRPPARYVNLGGGAYLDNVTGQVSDASSIKKAKDRAEREGIAARRGLKPGSEVYNVFVDEGKYPDWYGKPPAASGAAAARETPAQKQARLQKEADENFTPGTPEYIHHKLYGTPYKPEKSTQVAITPYQQEQLNLKRDEAKRKKDEDHQKALDKIETEEYGGGARNAPSLHAQRVSAGNKITAAMEVLQSPAVAGLGEENRDKKTARDSLIAARRELQNATDKLRSVYTKKYRMGAIDAQQYRDLLAGLQGEPVAPPVSAPPAKDINSLRQKYGY